MDYVGARGKRSSRLASGLVVLLKICEGSTIDKLDTSKRKNAFLLFYSRLEKARSFFGVTT